MEPHDIDEWVGDQFCSEHLVKNENRADIHTAFRNGLENNSLLGAIVQAYHGDEAESGSTKAGWVKVAMSIVAFVPDEIAQNILTENDPYKWREELLVRVSKGEEGLVLSDPEIHIANAKDGLNLYALVWWQEDYGYDTPGNPGPNLVLETITHLFDRFLRGFNLKSYILAGYEGKKYAQVESGFLRFSSIGAEVERLYGERLRTLWGADPKDPVPMKPNLAWVTREDAETATLQDMNKPLIQLLRYSAKNKPLLGLPPKPRELGAFLVANADLMAFSGSLKDAKDALYKKFASAKQDAKAHERPGQIQGYPDAGGPQRLPWITKYLVNHPEELRPWPVKRPNPWIML